jgi:hypothetical protein
MQRSLPRGITAVLSLLALAVAPACKDDKGDAYDQTGKQPQQAPSGEVSAGPAPADEAGPGEVEPGEAGAGEAGAVEAGAEAGAGEGQPADPGEATPEVVKEDLVPGLFEQAKSLDTDDAAATKALTDAIAAGAAKIDAAKLANERGEALLAAGEADRATVFFQWAADTHTLLSEPVYNLATLAAYAGDLEIAKEHLQELKKRGNKKLMKKVGVDPAFAPLHDDPDVRKIYEQ